MPVGDVRLAELLAALSVATDLGMGNPPEKAVRSCLVATGLARELDLPARDVQDVYYATLLQHLGCTAPAHLAAALFGDELMTTPVAERTDERRVREVAALLAVTGRGSGRARPGFVLRALTAREANRELLRSVCEVGTRLASRLGLGAGVRGALDHALEAWDGRHGVHGLAGDAIALPARVGVVATQAVVFDRLGGPDAALDVVGRRAGGWFDPEVAAAFARVGPGLLRGLADVDVWQEVLVAEPGPVRRVPASRLDDVAGAFGDMVDLKSPWTLGHSPGVAALAADAAARAGLDDREVTDVRRAALLHDLGRVAVSEVVWEAPRPLRTGEWEQVRLHAYHSERILERSATLAPLGRLAGRHHERLDGSGYHRASAASDLGVGARLLAVADSFQALTQDRPHRPGRSAGEAAEVVAAAAAAGTLDPECVRAVVAAAGEEPVRAAGWPAGLTDREVEVLRLLARGSSNREIAADLVVSRRTAEHHVQHIYAKIGVSTRAGAALFAVEHGLLR